MPGIVLREKSVDSGINRNDVRFLLEKLDGDEFIPVELNGNFNSVAMGFISMECADQLNYCYGEGSDLEAFVFNILDDMDLETADHRYEFKGIEIYLDR